MAWAPVGGRQILWGTAWEASVPPQAVALPWPRLSESGSAPGGPVRAGADLSGGGAETGRAETRDGGPEGERHGRRVGGGHGPPEPQRQGHPPLGRRQDLVRERCRVSLRFGGLRFLGVPSILSGAHPCERDA